MSSSNRFWGVKLATCLVVGGLFITPQAFADDEHCCVDWNRLNLSAAQSQQIQTLEQQWQHDYNDIKPSIMEDQQKLTKMLADHTSDTVEIMSLNQTIARKKEHLNAIATANYLRKRQLLNESQQFSLEQMIRDAVRRRQAAMHPAVQGGEVVTDRIQNLMQRVRNIWPVQSER